MEQQPPPKVPNPYTVVHDAPKPASIKVFGILNIVFGAMGLICGGAIGIFLIGAMQSPEIANEFNREFSNQYAEGHITFLLITSCFGAILILILIVCGVGLLRARSWGRTGSVVYAAIQILYTLASTGVSLTFSAVGAMCGVLFSMIYPICILFFLTRPSVVEALKE